MPEPKATRPAANNQNPRTNHQTNSSTQSPATIIHTSISKQYSNLQTHYPELTDQQPAIISQKSK